MKIFIFLGLLFFSGSFTSCMNSTESRQEVIDLYLYEQVKIRIEELQDDSVVRNDIYCLLAIQFFKLEARCYKLPYKSVPMGPRVAYHLARCGLCDKRSIIDSEYLRVWKKYNEK